MVRVAIFDYGAGNIFSLQRSLERQGATADVITDLGGLSEYSGLLLPGVGNFDPAIKKITGSGRTTTASASAASAAAGSLADATIPILGICLGMEMFFERSEEGNQQGFGIMDGSVELLPPSLKVPHMGWNDLQIRRPGMLLEGVKEGSWVYFVHSYRAVPASYEEIVTAESDYGVMVPAVVERDNFFGTQFHPEKSGSVGKTIIGNFLGVCKR